MAERDIITTAKRDIDTKAQRDTNTYSHLLELPPELRNRIYRATPIEPSEIYVKARSTPPLDPPFLVCRSIREEAMGIYYEENFFVFEIIDLDAANYIKWCRLSYAKPDRSVAFEFRSQKVVWSNVMVWMEAYWDFDCQVPHRKFGEGLESYDAIAMLAELVDSFRDDGMTWDKATKHLEVVRLTLATQKSEWAED